MYQVGGYKILYLPPGVSSPLPLTSLFPGTGACINACLCMHVSFTDCTSVMTELSTRWSSLASEQQDEWKCKASEGTHWLEKPRRVVRDRAKYRKLQLEKLNALNVAYIDSVWCGRQCL